jgi:ketosteroid isomerase-like protein
MEIGGVTAVNSQKALLKTTYAAFNARDMQGALRGMHADVEWPNGMEGGTVHGHEGIREYWTRQWGLLNPHVEPMQFTEDETGRIATRVHQVVKDLAGKVLVDQMIDHIYTFKDGLIREMEIRKLE